MSGQIEDYCEHHTPIRFGCVLCHTSEKYLKIVPRRTVPQYDELLSRIDKLEQENKELRHNNAIIRQRLNDLLVGLDKINL
jgi:hypothetical protein